MKNNKDIIKELRHRELHGTIPQRDFRMMRMLVESPQSRFKVILKRQIPDARPASFSRHLYINNFKKCYNIRNCKQRPFMMYNQPAEGRAKRTESAVLFESPISHSDFQASLKDNSYRPCLIQVTADGWLYRTDMHTGAVLQEVFLQPQYKFKHVSWERDLKRIVIHSVQNHSNTTGYMTTYNQPGHRNVASSVVIHLALFNAAPFEFLCLAPIDKRIFGNDVVTATISSGLLVVKHQKKILKFYNFEELIQKYCVRYQLGQEYNGGNGIAEKGFIGRSPLGLVPNLIITEKPVELLRICSDQDAVHFGGFPWHYTTMPTFNKFQVHELSSRQVVKNGTLETEDLDMNSVYFHGDNSGRILHVGAHTVRFLSLSQSDSGLSSLKEDFAISSAKYKPTEQQAMFTSSGRQIKKRMNASLIELQTESLHDIDYDDELGLLVVLSSTVVQGGETKGSIGLYDNQTGHLVREIILQDWEEESEHIVFIDRDTIVVMTSVLLSRPLQCTVLQLEK